MEQLRPDVPPAVAAVVRKLMAKRPEDRYQTPAEAAARLASARQTVGAAPWRQARRYGPTAAGRRRRREAARRERAADRRRGSAGGLRRQAPGARARRRCSPRCGVGVSVLGLAACSWLSWPTAAGVPCAPGRRGPAHTDAGADAFDQWLKESAALPAEKQVEAVAAKLKERNPGFDGKVTPKIENGVVTGLEFLTDNVTDISPVRALAGVASADLSGAATEQGPACRPVAAEGHEADAPGLSMTRRCPTCRR